MEAGKTHSIPCQTVHVGSDAVSTVTAGFSCILIIVVSKLLGVGWLMKREDFYDD